MSNCNWGLVLAQRISYVWLQTFTTKRKQKLQGLITWKNQCPWTLKVLRWSHQTLLTDCNVPDPTLLWTKKLYSQITSLAGQSQVDSSSNLILHLADARRWRYVKTCPNAIHWFYSHKQPCLNAKTFTRSRNNNCHVRLHARIGSINTKSFKFELADFANRSWWKRCCNLMHEEALL